CAAGGGPTASLLILITPVYSTAHAVERVQRLPCLCMGSAFGGKLGFGGFSAGHKGSHDSLVVIPHVSRRAGKSGKLRLQGGVEVSADIFLTTADSLTARPEAISILRNSNAFRSISHCLLLH